TESVQLMPTSSQITGSARRLAGPSLPLLGVGEVSARRRHVEVVAQRLPDPPDRLPGLDGLLGGAVPEGVDRVAARQGPGVRGPELLVHQRPELAEPHCDLPPVRVLDPGTLTRGPAGRAPEGKVQDV